MARIMTYESGYCWFPGVALRGWACQPQEFLMWQEAGKENSQTGITATSRGKMARREGERGYRGEIELGDYNPLAHRVPVA